MQVEFLKYTEHAWSPPKEIIFYLLISSSGTETTRKRKNPAYG